MLRETHDRGGLKSLPLGVAFVPYTDTERKASPFGRGGTRQGDGEGEEQDRGRTG